MRKDKAKSIAKVAKVVLNNPLLTRDEIAKEAGVGQGTASRALEELDANGRKDPRILGLTDEDFVLMEKIQKEKNKRLEEAGKINNRDLDTWEQTATKRYSLFRGNATDDKGGLKQPDVTFQIVNPNFDGEENN